MLVTIDQPSAELNVDGSTMSANCVISDGLVTMCTKNGTLAIAWSQRCAPVQEKLKLLHDEMNTLQAPGSLSMPLATLLVTTPLPGRAFIIAGMSLSPRPSSFLPLLAALARSSTYLSALGKPPSGGLLELCQTPPSTSIEPSKPLSAYTAIAV